MDADGWLTKADAATRLGVGERTVERLAARGALTARMRPGFPTMYNPEDVDRMASASRTVHRAAIAAADPTTRANGNGHGALVRQEAPVPEPLVEPIVRFLELLTTRLAIGPTGPTGPTPIAPLYVSVDEAACLTGLSRPTVRRMVAEGKLPFERDRGGIKIRRDAL